jgi:hypothetical protein
LGFDGGDADSFGGLGLEQAYDGIFGRVGRSLGVAGSVDWFFGRFDPNDGFWVVFGRAGVLVFGLELGFEHEDEPRDTGARGERDAPPRHLAKQLAKHELCPCLGPAERANEQDWTTESKGGPGARHPRRG